MKVFRTFVAAALLSLTAMGISVDAAEKKNLYIYGDLHPDVAARLVKEFTALHPEVRPDFISMTSSEVFTKLMNDIAGRKVSADVLWLREPSLVAELVKGGYSSGQEISPQGSILPGADLGAGAFAVALDPVVIAYNEELLDKRALPLTRAALVKLLLDKGYKGGIGTLNPEKSDRGLLLLTQDFTLGRDFKVMAKAFGAAGIRQYADYGALIEAVGKGDTAIGYNIPLSGLIKGDVQRKSVKWYFMNDYTLALPETLITTRAGSNKAEARLWVEFIRSAKGQEIVSSGLNLYPVMSGIDSSTMSRSGGLPGGKSLKIIGAGEPVTRFNTEGARKGFILKWQELLKTGK